jgi:protein-S-isoprenylcysteine O-methyltransferase Ste14
LLAAAGAAFFYLQAVREERYCLTRFGEPYERYHQRASRFNVMLGVMRLLRERKRD